MDKLRDLINIDRRFQNSINLQLDIENDTKVNSYIPTRSSLNILGNFLNHIIDDREKANILIGPYGKGKSHLLLVLLAIISETDLSKTEKLIKKIKEVDREVAEAAINVQKRKRPFLPVIISGTEGDLNQAFLMGLVEALKRNNLDDVAPDSYYSEAIKTIDKWNNEYVDTYEQLGKKLEKYGKTIDELRKELALMDRQALSLFTKIYPKLTAGSEFRPLVQIEALKLYKEIVHTLWEQKGYGGIYIIFDEFSKYVEGHEKETFARDMKILQDMCEVAGNSKEQQIHITFVAHKSIKEYGNDLPKEMINAFTGVEGRLKEERFIVSAQNNYELIRHVVGKANKNYRKIIDDNKVNSEIIEKSYKIPCFESLFKEKDFREIVAYGCFPLFPLTAYALLNISEKVAQNERSIFTFLANDEKGSLVRLIEENDKMFSVDVIYDYFEYLFRENKTLTTVHNEWLKADYALSKAESDNEEKIIKAIAILQMIRKPEEVPIKKDNIRLAAGMGKEDFNTAITILQERQIIIYRSKQGIFAFKNNVGLNIEKEISQVVEKQPQKINLAEKIEEMSELEFVLPKQYNHEYTMTRYFKYVYMTPEQFLKVKKAEYLFDIHRADGLVICIIRTEELDESTLEKHMLTISDKRLILVYPKYELTQEANVRKLMAVRALLNDASFLEENQVLKQELKLYEEDLLFEINAELEQIYMPENKKSRCIYCDDVNAEFKTEIEFNRFLSDICADYYEHSPKINNELINRQNLSAQIKKARNQIVDTILEEGDYSKFDKGTSPEATIFRATMIHTGIAKSSAYDIDRQDDGCREILNEIGKFIKKSAGKKVSFSNLYKVLMGKGYGARKGIIPIFFAEEMSKLQDTPVIYLQDKEVEISSDIFNNINDTPENYYLYVEKESVQKEEYLLNLEELFLTEEIKQRSKSKRKRLHTIVEGIQRWYRSLDQYTLNFRQQTGKIILDEEQFRQMCSFRNIFRHMELNPREVLFEQIPEIVAGRDSEGISDIYGECINAIGVIKPYLDNHLEETKKEAAVMIKQLFGVEEKESLSACLKEWYGAQSSKAKTHIYNDAVTGFMSYLERINTNDESEITSSLSKIVYGVYVNDWKDGSMEAFIESLRKIKNQVEAIKESSDSKSGENKISFIDSAGNTVEKYYESDDEDSTSYFLKNAIEDALDEFGDSLELNQKLSVLVQTIEGLIKK